MRVHSRATMYRTAWILFAVSIVVPAFPAGGRYFSGPFAAVKAMLWTEAFSQGKPAPSFPVLALFAFALFSNLVFAYAPLLRKRAKPSLAARILWIATLVVNASIAFALPVFAATLGYWVWLAAFAAMAWALFATSEAHPVQAPGSDVPLIIWIGLAWLVFWLAVTAVHHYHLDEELERAAVADRTAEEARTLTHRFNDPDEIIPVADAVRIEQALSQLEAVTSSQLVVAIYREAPPGILEEFTLHTAELSRLGAKGLDNGVLLFVFMKERIARIEVGYGLEGELTDADSHRILEERLGPAFKRGDYSQGVEDTLSAISTRIQNAYKSGATPGEATLLYRQLKAELPKIARKAWPVINAADTGSRITLSIMATVLLAIALSGFWQSMRIVRAGGVAVRNLYRRQPLGLGIGKLEFAPIFDTLKFVILFGIPIAAGVGTVIIAGGGTFGGAGATLRW